MSSISNLAILIPAAGASRRMGSPKQLLKWRDTTLIGHAIATAQELNQEKILVVLGAYYDKIKPEIEGLNVQLLKNEVWENGLGSSIACGADYLIRSNHTFDGLVVLLPDQPLIVPSYLKAMIKEFSRDKKQIIATSYGDEKFGVPAIFDKCYFKELSLLIDDRGAKSLLNKYSKQVRSIDIVPLVSDIDTEENYKKMHKANHQS